MVAAALSKAESAVGSANVSEAIGGASVVRNLALGDAARRALKAP
jgi:hypothetical protein